MMYNIYGKEFSTFLKAKATFFNRIGNTQNKWVLGADYKTNKNYGKGVQFPDSTPPYRNLGYVNSTYRPRTFSDIPAFNQVGVYAEDQLSARLLGRELTISAGLRYDYYATDKQALSPRINADYALLPKKWHLRAAYGKLAKGPSLLYLHPQRAYFEYININEMADDYFAEDERIFMTTTRSFDTENKNLKIASNERIEIGTDLFLDNKRFSVTAFRDHLKNGYAMDVTQSSFRPVNYIEYVRTGDESEPIYEIAANNPVLAKFNVPTNNRQVKTQGVELDVDLGRFENIRTAFALNGAWIRNESYSDDYYYFDGNSTTGGAGRTHIALYEPNMTRYIEQSATTTLTTTHNIPRIGFVVTLRTQVVWNENNWTRFGNDSIPVKYISKVDGQVYDFDPTKKEEDEFKDLLRNVNRVNAIRESLPPLLSFHINITNREIAKHVEKSEETVSRWVNNHRQPPLDDLYKIAKYLKMDIRELLHQSEWVKRK